MPRLALELAWVAAEAGALEPAAIGLMATVARRRKENVLSAKCGKSLSIRKSDVVDFGAFSGFSNFRVARLRAVTLRASGRASAE